jgi:putative DNA primase/helicase
LDLWGKTRGDESWTEYGIKTAIANYLEETDKMLGGNKEEDAQGSPIVFDKEPEPYPEPVDGDELLDELEALIQKHVVTTKHNRIAISLWIVLSYLIDEVETLPLLVINSPTKRCGKTRLVDLITRLVPKPITGVSFSSATIFRIIEKYCPTLLVDEGDTMFRDNEELRQVFNGGHTLTDPYVYRCVGDDHEPRRFSVWAAKVISLIGKLPPTLTDRSVIVKMARRAKGEKAERLRKTPKQTWIQLRQKIKRWVKDNHSAIADACEEILPTMPDVFNDRAEENWVPLTAIAKLASAKWLALTGEAMKDLEGYDVEDDSPAEYLIKALERLFCQRLAKDHESKLFSLDKYDDFHIASSEIVTALNKDKDAPWADWHNGQGLTEHKFAQLLREFDVTPEQQRHGKEGRPRGYRYGTLKPVFARYPSPPAKEESDKKPDEKPDTE